MTLIDENASDDKRRQIESPPLERFISQVYQIERLYLAFRNTSLSLAERIAAGHLILAHGVSLLPEEETEYIKDMRKFIGLYKPPTMKMKVVTTPDDIVVVRLDFGKSHGEVDALPQYFHAAQKLVEEQIHAEYYHGALVLAVASMMAKLTKYGIISLKTEEFRPSFDFLNRGVEAYEEEDDEEEDDDEEDSKVEDEP